MIKNKGVTIFVVLMSFLFLGCKNSQNKSSANNPIKENILKTDSLISKQKIVTSEKDSKRINYDSIIAQLEPELITIDEFENFKKKSNYIQVIEAYDEKNPSELLDGKKNQDNISYYELPTEINTKEYTSNSILFGDLNEDGKRDCIITAYRSDGYNEVAFFYVFINYGNTFKLEDVKSEDDVCGCQKSGWPNRLRNQKIEDGYLKGITECHFEDAHCCPTMIFQTKIVFVKGGLQFHSTEFIMDDYPYKREIPKVDSILKKSKI